MLHPHVPESLHHFGKHLLATFLGLLMAVGLESCHQEHQRKKVADAALIDVEQEILQNLKEVQKVAQSYNETPEQFQKMIDFFKTIREARLANRPWVPPSKGMSCGMVDSLATMRSAAWSMALASQSVARFPAGKGMAYAELYEEFQKFRQFQDRPVNFSDTQLLPNTLNASVVAKLDIEDLRRGIWGLQNMKSKAQNLRDSALELETLIQQKMGTATSGNPSR